MLTRPPERKSLSAFLTERFGIATAIDVLEGSEGLQIDVWPEELEPREGFVVRTIVGWRHVRAELRLGTYSAHVLEQMSSSDASQRKEFRSLVSFVLSNGGKVMLQINGAPAIATDCSSWPQSWSSLSLSVERTPLMIDHDSSDGLRAVIVAWGGALYGMVISLLPKEIVSEGADLEVRGLPEGAVERVEVNRYERSRINRAMCIAMFGARCTTCDFDFGDVYGERGADFIVVHHVTPVSKLGTDYVINPATDLVPVCANCHAMLHRTDPPLPVHLLKQLVSSRKG